MTFEETPINDSSEGEKKTYRLGKLKNGCPAAPISVANAAPRCTARSKRTGKPCRQPAMRGKKVCRFHGGKSTGPKTRAGRAKIAATHYKHGRYSKEAIAARKENAQWWKENMGRTPPRPNARGRPDAPRDDEGKFT